MPGQPGTMRSWARSLAPTAVRSSSSRLGALTCRRSGSGPAGAADARPTWSPTRFCTSWNRVTWISIELWSLHLAAGLACRAGQARRC